MDSNSPRQYFFAGGGTGGHIYPALAIAEQIKIDDPSAKIHFFCSDRPIDSHILSQTDFTFTPLSAQGLSPKPKQMLRFITSQIKSYKQVKPILANAENALVFGVGGFASAPAVIAAKKLHIPIIMVNVDYVPGKANKTLARFADEVFVQFEDTVKYFKNCKVTVTGCPLRQSFKNPDKSLAIKDLSLDPNKKTLLITGASTGAVSINRAICSLLDDLEQFTDWQIVHLTGKANYDDVKNAYSNTKIAHKIIDYYDDMASLYAASDLIIARAGAVSIAEFKACAVPVICLPYPYHKDNHQKLNAKELVSAGAAIIVEDQPDNPQATIDDLSSHLKSFLNDDKTLQKVAENAQKCAKPYTFEHFLDRIKHHN